jgi:hypothetical protein
MQYQSSNADAALAGFDFVHWPETATNCDSSRLCHGERAAELLARRRAEVCDMFFSKKYLYPSAAF